MYLFIHPPEAKFFRNIYLFTQIFIILLNVFIYLLAVGDEKYKVLYLLKVFVSVYEYSICLSSTFGDKGVAVLTFGAHNLSFSKKNLRITPDPDFRHFRNVLV